MAPADIPACAALCDLNAVMLRTDGWFVLAPITRSTGSAFVWRRARNAERILLDQVAGIGSSQGIGAQDPDTVRKQARNRPEKPDKRDSDGASAETKEPGRTHTDRKGTTRIGARNGNSAGKQ